MTEQEILAMQPGRELDAVVAEKVFGRLVTWNRAFQYLTDEEKKSDMRSFVTVPEYSTNISVAWEVEERIQLLGLSDEYGFQLYLVTEAGEMVDGIHNINTFKMAHSSPEQRCKAALIAIQGSECNATL